MIRLLVTNFFGVVNDNFLKTIAGFVVLGWIAAESTQSVFMGGVAAALVLPYILLSPLADRLTVVFRKLRILRLAKWAELPIVALAAFGFWIHSPVLVVAAIVLMGVQSSLYSPAKYALVRDIVGEDGISTGMGWMEGVSFLAVLSGTIAASFVADLEAVHPLVKDACLVAFAVCGLAASYFVRAREEPNRAIHAVNPWRYLRRAHRMANGYAGLNAVIMTLSVFWFVAAMLQMGMLVYGKQVMGLDATHTGIILALAAVGIVVGQVVAGFVDRRVYLLALVPVTGMLAGALLLLLWLVPMGLTAFAAAIAILAFDLGFFKLPLDAEIQKVVKGPRLNTMLAYFNQVSFLFMLAASGVYALVGNLFGPRAFLLVLAVTMFVAPVVFLFSYRSTLGCLLHWVLTRRYAVTMTGDIPDGRQTVLVLPNHPAMVDPMLVFTMLWKVRLSPLCDEAYLNRGGISAKVLKLVDAVSVPDLRRHRSAEGAKVARGLNGVVTGALEKGRNIVFYPSGHIWTEPREDIGTRQLAHNVCGELPPGVRVIGVRTMGLWGSIWGRSGGRSTPLFGPTLAKSVGLWFVCLLTRRRRSVSMHFEDITDRVKEWSQLPRLDFNRKLEEWYNRFDADQRATS